MYTTSLNNPLYVRTRRDKASLLSTVTQIIHNCLLLHVVTKALYVLVSTHYTGIMDYPGTFYAMLFYRESSLP